MSIVPMKRVSFCGLLREKAGVLEGLQALGVLHIIPYSVPEPLEPIEPALRHGAETALRYLMASPEQMRPHDSLVAFDAGDVVGRALGNRSRLRELADRRDELRALIKQLEPWGEFSLPSREQLGGQRIWLYALPLRERLVLDRLALPWQIVGREPTALHVAVVSRDEPAAGLLPAAPLQAAGTPLSQQRAELREVEIAIEKAEEERRGLTRWRLLLGADLAAAQDREDVRAASGQTLDDDGVFTVQGWAPAESAPALEAFASGHGLALLIEAPRAGELPPTLLRPADQRFAIGGDITQFYTSPGYRTWDPGLIVLVSFVIFFGMIVADAGYAVLIAAGTALYWRKMGNSAGGKRFRVLLAGIAAAGSVYGVAAGSYFGIVLPPGSFLATLQIIDLTNFNKMMRLSIVIGAVHISIALAVVAWLNRGTGRSVASLGWIIVIVGGLIMLLADHLRPLGYFCLAAGLAAVVLGSAANRPIVEPGDWRRRAIDGLLSLTGVTKLFGDVLSYLRLFALGLASASLAVTFNQIAVAVRSTHPGLGLLFAILVLMFGHAINFTIGIMSGVVHGLRLNYIEFFGWGLTEEGYPFRAFAKRKQPA